MKINRVTFYLLSFTWGLPLTLIGCLVAGVLRCLGYHPTRVGYSYCFEVGENWGGLELGVFFITQKSSGQYLKFHEFGHGVQNCVYGLFMIPVICIPSAIRYWYRELRYDRKGIIPKTDYYSIWFEKQASDWGLKNIEEEG